MESLLSMGQRHVEFALKYHDKTKMKPHGQKLPETQSEAGDRRSRLPSLRREYTCSLS